MIQKIPGKIQNVYELDEEELKSLSPFSRWLLNLNPDANLADLNSGEKHEYSGPEKEIDSPSTEPLRGDEPGILKKKKKKKKKSREKEGDTWKEHTEKKKKKKKKKSKDISIKQRAKRSLELSQELVTEPLAELLASQGHKEEAIVMFTKLSLIFPKKSSYFADRINRLKNN
jgi:hypothetical protein